MSPVLVAGDIFIFVSFNSSAMSDNSISEKESLQIIQEMILKARNHFTENGHLYLIWGWVILFCSIAHFVLHYFMHVAGFSKIWILTWLVLAYQVYYISRRKREARVRSHTDSVVGLIWSAFAVALFLCGFAIIYVSGIRGASVYAVLYPVFLALYGIPTFLSGAVLKVAPLKWGGVGCWILSVCSVFIPADFQILLLGVAAIIAWIIPGYWLQQYHKKVNS